MRSFQPKILLVQPQAPTSYWSFDKAIRFMGAKAVMPPLSLITVAGLLPQTWQFRLVDENIERLTDRDIQWADYVFVSGMIVHRVAIQRVLEQVKRMGVSSVVGGPFVTSLPEAPELKLASARVLGELEDQEFVANLVNDLVNHTLQPVYHGTDKPSLAQAPVPRFDLLNWRSYNSLAIQMSRGCPHQCEFCDIIVMYGRRPRYKTAEQVLAELTAIYELGYRGNVFIVDDNFIGNIKLVEMLLEPLQAWQEARGFPFQFYTEADMRLARLATLMDRMVQAGFFAVFMGIESPSEAALLEVKKGQNTKIDLVESIHEIRRHGLLIYGGFIVGFDHDGPEAFEAMVQFVEAAAVDFAMVGTLIALAGTPLEARLAREGRLTYVSDGDHFKLTNVIPLKLTQLELVRGYRWVLERLYAPGAYFSRARRALEEWHPGVVRTTTWRELKVVPKSFVLQGMVASYRREYWRFMVWVKLHRPKALPRAFAMAVSYAHFYYYTRRVVVPRLLAAEQELMRQATA